MKSLARRLERLEKRMRVFSTDDSPTMKFLSEICREDSPTERTNEDKESLERVLAFLASSESENDADVS